MIEKLSLLFCSLLFTACVSNQHKSEPNSLVVMTYNVENLFDAENDPNKNDDAYLPIEQKQNTRHRIACQKAGKAHWIKQCIENDWSEAKIKRKLGRLADVILQVKDGKGADVLILQEVENKQIVERLRTEYLQAAGYKETILIEGPDERGIDTAILSRLPQIDKAILHEVKLTKFNKQTNKQEPGHPTQGILQARFKLPDGQALAVMGVHFPSQGAPTVARVQAIEALIAAKQKLPKTDLLIVGGDFNITTKEDGQKGLFGELLAEHFIISHYVGCSDCKGTHNYRGEWSFLDALLFSKNFATSTWKVDTKSIRLANKSLYQMDYQGAPARFRGGYSQTGISDHFPLAVDIKPWAVK